MKNIKKIIGLFTAMSILSTGIPVAFAVSNSAANEVIYKIAENENSVYEVKRQDLEADHWDVAKLANGDIPVEPFVDFPMSVESSFNNAAELTVSLAYLKHIEETDSVTVTLTQYDTGAEFVSKNLTNEDHILYISDIPIGQAYSVVLNETLDRENNVYSSIITTEYSARAFLPDLTLDNVTDAEGITLKVNEARTEENAGKELDAHIISATQLPELYTTLPSGKLYLIQMSKTYNGIKQLDKAFFSTEFSQKDLDIFIPKHTFYGTEEDYLNSLNQVQPLAMSASSHMGEDTWTLEDLEANVTYYNWDEDVYLNFPTASGKTYKLFKVTLRENWEDFTFRTFGNDEMNASYWIYNPTIGGNPEFHYIPTRKTNISASFGYMEGYVFYFLVQADVGKCVFNVYRNDVADDVTNSMYELSHPENGIPAYTPYNTKLSCSIDYGRDVDVFYIDRENNYSTQNYSVRVTNLGMRAQIKATIYADMNEDDTFFEYSEGSLAVSRDLIYDSMDFVLPRNGKYFVSIHSGTDSVIGDYQIEILHPTFGDELESNNSTIQATVLSDNSGMLETPTLHYRDVDYYKFNTGAGGADVDISLYETAESVSSPKLYEIELFEDSNNSTIFQPEVFSHRKRIKATDLTPNMDYFIKISSSGSNYSPGGCYALSYKITKHAAPAYSAVITENVSLTVQEDTVLTNLDTIMATLMSKLTCKSGDTVVSPAQAQNDVKLYYMNGSNKVELTAAVINGLSVGSYSVIAEYHGIAATGGTITLTVTPASASESVAEISGIEFEIVDWEEMDFLAAAKMVANVRLVREGYEINTTDLFVAADDLGWDYESRGTLDETINAAIYFYNDNQTSDTRYFVSSSVSESTAENTLFNTINSGKAVIMQLTSTGSANDMSQARYLVLCGVNKDNHTYKVYDPITGDTPSWVAAATLFGGGYGGNSALKFTGRIIEGRSK